MLCVAVGALLLLWLLRIGLAAGSALGSNCTMISSWGETSGIVDRIFRLLAILGESGLRLEEAWQLWLRISTRSFNKRERPSCYNSDLLAWRIWICFLTWKELAVCEEFMELELWLMSCLRREFFSPGKFCLRKSLGILNQEIPRMQCIRNSKLESSHEQEIFMRIREGERIQLFAFCCMRYLPNQNTLTKLALLPNPPLFCSWGHFGNWEFEAALRKRNSWLILKSESEGG